MTPSRLPRTAAVLGGGAIGCVLLPALRTVGVRIVSAWTRTPKTPQWRTGSLPRALREAELILLSVSDEAIGPLCAQLAAERLVGPGQLVAHLAGALDLSPLAPALQAGARVGSLHPLRAVPPGSRADALAGATAGIDGSDEDARAQLTALAQSLDMQPLPASGTRALYHAAAVLAGGAQVALFAEAVRTFQAATGSTEPEARAALLPLARGALETLASRDPAQAITGPIPRGDAQTLTAHLHALGAADPRVAELYRQLAQVALDLSRGAARATPEQLTALDTALAAAPAKAPTSAARPPAAKAPAVKLAAVAPPAKAPSVKLARVAPPAKTVPTKLARAKHAASPRAGKAKQAAKKQRPAAAAKKSAARKPPPGRAKKR